MFTFEESGRNIMAPEATKESDGDKITTTAPFSHSPVKKDRVCVCTKYTHGFKGRQKKAFVSDDVRNSVLCELT